MSILYIIAFVISHYMEILILRIVDLMRIAFIYSVGWWSRSCPSQNYDTHWDYGFTKICFLYYAFQLDSTYFAYANMEPYDGHYSLVGTLVV